MSSKRRGSQVKVFKDVSRKNASTPSSERGLKQQYEIIRKDLEKLRLDIHTGWVMAREKIKKRAI